MQGLRRALTQVEREITNYARTIASPDMPLQAAEERRAALQAKLAQQDANQQTAVVQLTPAAREHRL